MAELARTATEYVYAAISNIDPVTGLEKDLSAGTPSMAFVAPSARPQAGDWHAATWSPGYPPFVVRLRVGPAGDLTTLTPGPYRVWGQVVTADETAQMPAGFLRIT